MHVHSHSQGGPCPSGVAAVFSRVFAGERLYVIAASRDDAEAIADTLRDRGVLGIHQAGSLLEIHPDRIH